jgi:hypothetical protein
MLTSNWLPTGCIVKAMQVKAMQGLKYFYGPYWSLEKGAPPVGGVMHREET